MEIGMGKEMQGLQEKRYYKFEKKQDGCRLGHLSTMVKWPKSSTKYMQRDNQETIESNKNIQWVCSDLQRNLRY